MEAGKGKRIGRISQSTSAYDRYHCLHEDHGHGVPGAVADRTKKDKTSDDHDHLTNSPNEKKKKPYVSTHEKSMPACP